jgi:DNA-binding response OmpR family regulator
MAHILQVDDDRILRITIGRVLAENGHSVHTVGDGPAAIDYVRERKPDLLISDVMMPGMDGWEVVQTLRTMPEGALLPVIFLTSRDTPEDRMTGFSLEADDYISKAVQPEELVMRVNRALDRAERLRNAAIKDFRTKNALTGQLSQVSLAALLTLLNMQNATGELLVTRQALTARVWLRDGRVLKALFTGMSQPRNLACLGACMGWVGGSFAFAPSKVLDRDEIGLDTADLIKQSVTAAR